MWRCSLALLALLGVLLAACDGDSPGPVTPPTSRSDEAPDTTTSTFPPARGGFVSAWLTGRDEVWGLFAEPCPEEDAGGTRCAVLSRSTTGGGSWTRVARLDVAVEPDSGPDFVRRVQFADGRHGWVYDPGFFATFNSGRRWQRVDLGHPVVALASTGNLAYALVGTCGGEAGGCRAPIRLFEGTIATGRWRFVRLDFELPATDTGSLVVSRSGVYALVVGPDAEQDLLARSTAGRWERRTVPCPRALITAIQGEDGLVAACRPTAPAGPVELQTSSDGGSTWAVVGQHSFVSTVTSLVVAGQTTVVGLENGDVERSTDNGMSFSTVVQAGGVPVVRFSNAEHGLVLAGPPADRNVFRTTDGGATWVPVPPPA